MRELRSPLDLQQQSEDEAQERQTLVKAGLELFTCARSKKRTCIPRRSLSLAKRARIRLLTWQARNKAGLLSLVQATRVPQANTRLEPRITVGKEWHACHPFSVNKSKCACEAEDRRGRLDESANVSGRARPT